MCRFWRSSLRIRRHLLLGSGALSLVLALLAVLVGLSSTSKPRPGSPRPQLRLGSGGETEARAAGSAPAAAEPRSTATAPSVHVARVGNQVFVDGNVLVGFRPGVSAAARRRIERAIGLSTPRQITPALDLLPVSPGHVLRVIRALEAQRGVRYAEPDYVARASGAPNDPFFGQQWGFANTGQLVNGTTGAPGADEHAVPAWSVATGSRSVVIAETDTGVDYNHPDLAANIWSNPGGIGGCPAGTHGYNVITSTCDPIDDDTYYGGHGTHVAGIMGAQGNNGVGVTGVNWATSILPVKWLDSSANDPSSGSSSGLISALQWVLQAKQRGVNVRVLNDSATFVGTAYSQALSDEIDTLGKNGILFVTAAGNHRRRHDRQPQHAALSLRLSPCY